MYTQRKVSKYKNIKTTYNGQKYDSAFEASVACDLDIRLKAGEIASWERQYKVEMWAYNCHGDRVLKKSHKVDFRLHELDGSFTLLEAKGFHTDDWLERRKWLEKLWLPENMDHKYEVVYQKKSGKSVKKSLGMKVYT